MSAIAIVFVGVALYFNIKIAYKNTNLFEKRLEDQRFQARNRLIIERFSKSVEQLNSSKPQVRIGGIYSLEQIAIESSRDHWTIVEILTSFIAESFPLQLDLYDQSLDREDELPEIAIDVQAALTVIGRRNFAQDPEGKYLNLSFTYPIGSDLSRARLCRTDLSRAYLSGANFSRADLIRANLREADLREADLWKANLNGATLNGATLLSGADLSGAKNLTPEQVKSAQDWRGTKYDEEFHQQLE
ncbi:MAG: pentapeptide repeat-containing protein [Hydrococcus sp. C42_A2020_068]|nr:pentapeptide repeat-containing protein [Hydrococcus sp. C42_A2020_068]